MKPITLIFLITCLCSVRTYAQPDTGKIILLTYGPDYVYEYQNAENIVSDRWGMGFYRVAGCMVPDKLKDSVDRYNSEAEQPIIEKYGRYWRSQFKRQVRVEYRKRKVISSLIGSLECIADKQAEMIKAGNDLHYYMQPVKGSEKYTVSVEGWTEINNETAWVRYYSLIVGPALKTTEIVSDRVEVIFWR